MTKTDKIISIIKTVCDKDVYDANDVEMVKTLGDILLLTIRRELIIKGQHPDDISKYYDIEDDDLEMWIPKEKTKNKRKLAKKVIARPA